MSTITPVLTVRGAAGAVAFYQKVFGWDTAVASDEPGFRYTTLGEGEWSSSDVRAVVDVVQGLLGSAQAEVGRRWEANQWSVADEHAATAISEIFMGRTKSQSREV